MPDGKRELLRLHNARLKARAGHTRMPIIT